MKTRFLFFALFTLLWGISLRVSAQANSQQIKTNLQTGNAIALSPLFADYVDLRLPDVHNSYSKAEAVQQMSAFFQKNRPTGFSVKHEGTAPNGSKFLIGTLQTASGSFRTAIVIRQNQIQELNLEK